MDKILFVDDDGNLLDSYARRLRREFDMQTATDGNQGLEAIEREGPYALVVSDLRMPGMDGIEFLSRVRTTSPESVRILLTGHADLQASIDAVNQAGIFRLLTKPCPMNLLIDFLSAGLREFRTIQKRKIVEEEVLDMNAWLEERIRRRSSLLQVVNEELEYKILELKQYQDGFQFDEEPGGPMTKLITTAEASKKLGISISTVQRYFDRGKLKGEKNMITGRRLIDTGSVCRLIQECSDLRRLLPEAFSSEN